ncbi:MAG: hybrid sensor histidine kinase/response regulator, partial [bacterium]
RAEKDKFETWFRYNPNAVHIVDDKGIILDVNIAWCEIFRASREDVVGQPIFKYIPDERSARSRHALGIAGERLESLPFRTYRRGDGSTFLGKAAKTFVGRENRIAITTVINVTDQVMAEAQLADANSLIAEQKVAAAVGRLAAGVSHLIRNLGGVMTEKAGQLVRDLEALQAKSQGFGVDQEVENAIATAQRLAAEAAQVGLEAGGMVSLARAGKQLDEEIINVRHELEYVVGQMLPTFGISANVQLNLTRIDAEAGLKITKALFHEILINLFKNAADAGATEILLEASYVDLPQGLGKRRHIQLEIEDNGSGIPAAVLRKIKNHEPVTSAKHQGLGGFGLFSLQTHVSERGGTVDVFSSERSGTRVIIQLPLKRSLIENPEQPEVGVIGFTPAQARQLRVATIDDDLGTNMITRGVAYSMGIPETNVAMIMGENFAAVKGALTGMMQKPNLFLIDIGMPGFTGIELINWIVEQNWGPAEFVLVTGYDALEPAQTETLQNLDVAIRLANKTGTSARTAKTYEAGLALLPRLHEPGQV